MLGQMLLATFDLRDDVLQAIVDGNMLFAIDQQQYMQGYLPIVYLTLYLYNLNTPGSFLIQTGPGFVTKDNAAQIINYAARGTR
jgi:simple sugar transport system substrate-binding protein